MYKCISRKDKQAYAAKILHKKKLTKKGVTLDLRRDTHITATVIKFPLALLIIGRRLSLVLCWNPYFTGEHSLWCENVFTLRLDCHLLQKSSTQRNCPREVS